MNDAVKVAVVGATGYAGFELARLLLRHPQIEKPTFYLRDANANMRCLTELTRNCAAGAKRLANHFQSRRSRRAEQRPYFFRRLTRLRWHWCRSCLEANPALRIVDLSGAFRFAKPETFAEWYKLAAPDPRYLPKLFTACRNCTLTTCLRRGWLRIPDAIRLP